VIETICRSNPIMATSSAMKKKSVKQQEKECEEILAACERTRQACNKLTDNERRRLHEDALAIIYGHDAKIPARSR
jgi:hypothetical protein